jgi:hypothetical protein
VAALSWSSSYDEFSLTAAGNKFRTLSLGPEPEPVEECHSDSTVADLAKSLGAKIAAARKSAQSKHRVFTRLKLPVASVIVELLGQRQSGDVALGEVPEPSLVLAAVLDRQTLLT